MVAGLLCSALLSAPVWTPVPLVSAEMRARGHRGGEGGQWPRSVAFAPSDPGFALFGTDVGGLFRSFDGGVTWSPCNVGFLPRGAADLEVDPRDPNRVLAVGMNSGPGAHHGLYLSLDRGGSWRPVLLANICSVDDRRDQVAFDPQSDAVYWSRIRHDQEAWGNKPEVKPRLYRSLDRGLTWEELPQSESWGGSWIKVHPRTGRVVAGNERGVFLSDDRGMSFRQTFQGEVTGLDVAGNRVFVSTPTQVWVSVNSGASFRALAAPPVESGHVLRGVKVSPANPRRLAIWRQSPPDTWNWPRFVSHDGGQSWMEARKDATGAFLPDNAREALYAWSPKQPDVLLSLGGDWPTRSTDGGLTQRFSGQGVNGVLVGGRFAWSLHSPGTLFFGSQDYNGAITRDSGRTWNYTPISDHAWGGFAYGGYAVTSKLLVVGNAAGWGAPRILRVSRDGGKSFVDTGIELAGPDVSYGDPTNPDIAFAFNHRTTDGGKTWSKMRGCEGVFSHWGRVLYGREGARVVRSADHGASWSTVVELPAPVEDIAAGADKLFAVAAEKAYAWDGASLRWIETPRDPGFGDSVRTVAVDPTDPRVVYMGRAGNFYATQFAVLRSLDAGQTWSNLTRTTPLEPGAVDGGREAICIRVHPKTREAFVSTSCYGIWKVAGP